MTIRDVVESIPLIDNHAHPVEPLAAETVRTNFADYFTEGDLSATHARHTLNYRAALSLLAERFDADEESALLERRSGVALEPYARDLIGETNTEVILADDGFPDVSPAEFRAYTDAEVRPLLRIEPVIEALLESRTEFDAFERAFDDRIEDAIDGEHVGLKTIVAYRAGLEVAAPDRSAARRAFDDVRTDWGGRIEDPTLLGYLVHRACDLAGERGVPIQFHTGFGDPDAHPRRVDPTLLADLVAAHPETPIVLLHAGYPYVREGGYVTATYDNAYLDISLAVPFVQHGSERVVESALELAPSTKVLYGSDAFSVPELYVLASRRGRDALATVLEELIEDGFVDEAYAETIARNVLRENVQRLYDL